MVPKYTPCAQKLKNANDKNVAYVQSVCTKILTIERKIKENV